MDIASKLRGESERKGSIDDLEENVDRLEYKRLETSKDDSFLVGRAQFFTKEDLLEQRLVE